MSEFPVLKASANGNFSSLAGAILYQLENGAKVVEVVAIGKEAWWNASKALIRAVEIASSKGKVISQTNPEYINLKTENGEMTGMRMVIYRLE